MGREPNRPVNVQPPVGRDHGDRPLEVVVLNQIVFHELVVAGTLRIHGSRRGDVALGRLVPTRPLVAVAGGSRGGGWLL